MLRLHQCKMFARSAATAAILIFFACTGPSDDNSFHPAAVESDTGSYAFRVVWDDHAAESRHPSRLPQALSDCGDIETVEAAMYDASGALLTSGSWPCSAHQGTLNDIPAGSNRTIWISGKDADGYVLYCGSQGGIAILANQIVVAENPIVAAAFSAPQCSALPEDGTKIELSSINFEWSPVSGASCYRLTISENSDLSSPVVQQDISSASFRPTGLIPGKTYYWTLCSLNQEGNQSPGSTVRSFTVTGDTPTANPTAAIQSPANNGVYATGSDITFSGSGNDPEDGVLAGNALTWSSDINGQIGTGESFTRNDLSAGTHAIRLTAMDQDGNTATASITITIQTTPPPSDSDGDGVTDDLDKCPDTPVGNPVDANGCTTPRFTDLGNGTVRDNETGLIWLKNASAFGTMNWDDARIAAAGLSHGEHGLTDGSANGDWQLPTRQQWESLVYTDYYDPALCNTAGSAQWAEGDVFTGVQSPASYWSNDEYDAARAWFVRMSYGATEYHVKTNDVLYVWPVRTTLPLPDSGMTDCYDANGAAISPCPVEGESFFGQDGCYSIHPRAYTKLDSSGIATTSATVGDWVMVQDNITGLIWEVKTNDGGIHDKDNQYSFSNAQSVFITQLNSNSFGGHSDWRMPTALELGTLVNNGVYYPAIDVDYFPNTTLECYWTETTCADDATEGWVFDFNWGGDRDYDKTMNVYTRAVRGKNKLTQSFTDNGDGTVTHNNTGLIWMKATSGSQLTWENALAYCESSTLAGYDDWRLPNISELRSIVDYSRHSPTINTTYFPDTYSAPYWSSTTISDNLDQARRINFSDADDLRHFKTDTLWVRGVRGGR